jgi:hypothetical protein
VPFGDGIFIFLLQSSCVHAEKWEIGRRMILNTDIVKIMNFSE